MRQAACGVPMLTFTLVLAYFALLGRLALSCLPAGEPGGHTLRELPVTLAVSVLLGAWVSAVLPHDGWAWIAGVPALALLVRMASLPGPPLPRGMLRTEPAGWAAHALLATALLLPLGLPDTWGNAVAEAIVLAPLCLLVDHGLALARRAVLERRLVVLALAVTIRLRLAPDWVGGDLPSTLGYGSGAALAVGWLRRADRRAGVLAALGFALPGLLLPIGDAIAFCALGMACLIGFTPAPSRAWIAIVSAVVFAAVVLDAWLSGRPPAAVPDGLAWPVATGPFLLLCAALTTATLAWVLRTLAARRDAEPSEERAELARGNLFLLVLLTLGLLLAGVTHTSPAPDLAPVAFLLVGCLAVRPERSA